MKRENSGGSSAPDTVYSNGDYSGTAVFPRESTLIATTMQLPALAGAMEKPVIS